MLATPLYLLLWLCLSLGQFQSSPSTQLASDLAQTNQLLQASVELGDSSNHKRKPSRRPNHKESKMSYIITFKEDTTQQQLDDYEHQLVSQGGHITHRYTSVLKGFAVKIEPSALNSLQQNPQITGIEPDGEVHTS
ncbi:hypothetical protein O181_059678 [Austropuccinia psidii MF-1]|uniref:Inhibitor I9 domain-containing protein n=1 Tax=Austropuccinia psidii MF-1 TaxID=1389203 RepID=A0A9Q3EF87_9BASI|nr:hypothetical protein [Austropuccinia psidii MF-1]